MTARQVLDGRTGRHFAEKYDAEDAAAFEIASYVDI